MTEELHSSFTIRFVSFANILRTASLYESNTHCFSVLMFVFFGRKEIGKKAARYLFDEIDYSINFISILRAAFFGLRSRFVFIFLGKKEIGKLVVHKMLVKLTTDHSIKFWHFHSTSDHCEEQKNV